MTDAQLQAWDDTRATLNETHRRIISLIETLPGSTISDVMRRHKTVYNITLEKNAASGRLSELANEGIIYVQGRKNGQSRYYFEPDPACRFQIREQREAESFLRWLRAGEAKYLDRLPGHVRKWLEGQKALLEEPEKSGV